jgi:hypothetical protein
LAGLVLGYALVGRIQVSFLSIFSVSFFYIFALCFGDFSFDFLQICFAGLN